MATGFSLPEGVHKRAATATNLFVEPHPGFRVDRLTDRTEQPQAGKIIFVRLGSRVDSRSLDQGADSGRRRIENTDLVLLYHLPETTGIRISRNPFEYNLGHAQRQRPIS